MKLALLLGVEIQLGVEFEDVKEPKKKGVLDLFQISIAFCYYCIVVSFSVIYGTLNFSWEEIDAIYY